MIAAQEVLCHTDDTALAQTQRAIKYTYRHLRAKTKSGHDSDVAIADYFK